MTDDVLLVPLGSNPYAKIARESVADPSMALKAFSAWLWNGETPENNWDLEYAMPEWLQEIHNKYQGRCFLMGTGPSLAEQAALMPKLASEYVFTCNRMHLWKELGIRPFVHCVTEPQPFLEWGTNIAPIYDHPNAQNKVAVMWWPVRVPGWLWCPKAPEEIQIRWQGFYGMGEPFRPLPTGWASPLTISQLAAWMGFREFIFLGIDTTQQGQAWDPTNGRTLQARNIRSIMECFDRARVDIQRLGGVVYDCTPGGRINREGILPYRSLEDVLSASPMPAV